MKLLPKLIRARMGSTASVEVSRDGIVSKVQLVITGYDRPVVKLVEIADATSAQKKLQDKWLTAGL